MGDLSGSGWSPSQTIKRNEFVYEGRRTVLALMTIKNKDVRRDEIGDAQQQHHHHGLMKTGWNSTSKDHRCGTEWVTGPGSCANEIVNSYLQRVYNEVTHVARENFWRNARVRAKFRTN